MQDLGVEPLTFTAQGSDDINVTWSRLWVLHLDLLLLQEMLASKMPGCLKC